MPMESRAIEVWEGSSESSDSDIQSPLSSNRAEKTVQSLGEVTTRNLRVFYECLTYARVLGQMRGEHTSKQPLNNTYIDSLDQKQLIRSFLNDLAWTADYKKGGETVTAIGLQHTPEKCVFVVAANKNPAAKAIPFLESLLGVMKTYSTEQRLDDMRQEVLKRCVTFHGQKKHRIRRYAQLLVEALNCVLKGATGRGQTDLAEYTERWITYVSGYDKDRFEDLVDFAFRGRHSKFMRLLNKCAQKPEYKTGEDSFDEKCATARHYIGRLGHYVRVAEAMTRYAARLPIILDSYSIHGLTPPRKSKRPSAGNKTDIEKAFHRMYGSSRLGKDEYQMLLNTLKRPIDLSGRFDETYREDDFDTKVHAEAQILHYFYQNKLKFVGDDKNIACSKPACYCCLLYFRYHPGRFVEPESHNKIYLAWQPPGLGKTNETGIEDQLPSILYKMKDSVRDDVLNQIRQRLPRTPFHHDSITGVTSDLSSKASISAEDQEHASPTDEGYDSSTTIAALGHEGGSLSRIDSLKVALHEIEDFDTPDKGNGGVSLLGYDEYSVVL